MSTSSLMNQYSDKQKTSYLDSLDEQQRMVAEAYVDIETAYIIFDNTKKFSALAKAYCKEGQIDLPNSNVTLVNEAKGDRDKVTLVQLSDFLETISDENEDELHQQAKRAMIEKGFRTIRIAPSLLEAC